MSAEMASRSDILSKSSRWGRERKHCSEKGQVSGKGTLANASMRRASPLPDPSVLENSLFLMTDKKRVAKEESRRGREPVLADNRHQ